MKVTVIFAAFITLLTSLPASAGPEARLKLGSVRLADAKDRDTIHLPPCNGSSNKKVNKLSFKVQAYAAEVDSLKVIFQNGDHQLFAVKSHFLPNSSSRWLDLNGENRCIAKIVVKGDSDTRFVRPGKQAKMTFFAR